MINFRVIFLLATNAMFLHGSDRSTRNQQEDVIYEMMPNGMYMASPGLQKFAERNIKQMHLLSILSSQLCIEDTQCVVAIEPVDPESKNAALKKLTSVKDTFEWVE